MAEAAKEEDEVVQNVQDINLPARVNNLVIGDLNLQVRGNLNEENGATVLGAPNASLEERVKEKDAYLRVNQKYVAHIKVQSQETTLVKLLVIHKKDVQAEGSYEFLFYSGNEGDARLLAVDELQSAAKKNADQEARCKFSEQVARSNYVAKHGRFIVITGGAGYGKTTLGIQIMQHVCDTQPESGYLFHENLPSLDNSKDSGVLEFLTRPSNPHWLYQPQTDNKILEKISKSKNVVIVMDSMDETDFNLSMKAPVIGLYDRAKPEVILQNLLRGNVLPNAFVYLITRLEAYLQLHLDCKSHFPLEVIGLGEKSQDLLFKEICHSEEEYKNVKEVVQQNLAAKALSCIPIFAKAIPKYILRHGFEHGAITTTDVFTSFLNDYIRSANFKNHPNVLRKLSKLALYGMLENKFLFEAKEFTDLGCEIKDLDDFLKIQVQSSDINLKILEGDKSILFNHRLLQEFFAALQLMFDTPLEGFTNHQTKFESVQFEMVLQFLFGLLNPELHGKLKALFPISLADISDKKRFLEDLLVSMAEKFTKTSVEDFPLSLDGVFDVVFYEKWEKFLARPVDNSLFKLCSLAYESMDPELTKTLVKVFPNMVLLSRTILPSHVASLCHVLRATDNPIAITIGSFVEQANFIGDGLKMLIETVSQTPHTIRKFHIAYAPMEIATLAPLIPQMEALTLWQCDLSCQDIKLISESLQKKTCPIELLDLSLNHMDEAGVELLCLCLPKIRRLRLVQCRITSDHFLLLANRIEQLQHPMAVLDLNGNTIGSDCARCWAILAHKVDVLGLRNCGIYEIGVFTDAIARRNYPMEAIDISQNPLGDRGASALARCRKNIERLVRSNCNFTAAGVETLESAELRLLQNQAGRDHRTLISVLWTALQNAFQ